MGVRAWRRQLQQTRGVHAKPPHSPNRPLSLLPRRTMQPEGAMQRKHLGTVGRVPCGDHRLPGTCTVGAGTTANPSSQRAGRRNSESRHPKTKYRVNVGSLLWTVTPHRTDTCHLTAGPQHDIRHVADSKPTRVLQQHRRPLVHTLTPDDSLKTRQQRWKLGGLHGHYAAANVANARTRVIITYIREGRELLAAAERSDMIRQIA